MANDAAGTTKYAKYLYLGMGEPCAKQAPIRTVSALPIPRSALALPIFPSPTCLIRISLVAAKKLSTAACAQECLSKTIKFESKSIKKATFSVKKASKKRAFRHAHLNIWGGHPLWR